VAMSYFGTYDHSLHDTNWSAAIKILVVPIGLIQQAVEHSRKRNPIL
jgi:hypothetical protein